MKRIIIPTIGTRGDIQPYIALALGLKNAGYEVIIASHPAMQTLVQSYQLSFSPIGPDIDIGSQAALIRRRSPGWIVGFLRVMRFTYELLEAAHADLLTLCLQADLVIVSHTAAGTTAVGFRAGIPTLVIPHIIDQFNWGRKVAELGAGPAPIPRKKLTKKHLLNAINQLQSTEILARAAEIGKKIQAEPDGVQKAVELINKEY